MPRILIVTGEASGDLHGANLARALRARDASIKLVGIGGAAMRAADVPLVSGIAQVDVIGLGGPSAVRAIWQRVRAIRRLLQGERWDLVVLIDNPGLNFHFARVAKAAGHRVLYYIAPQIWAWRPGRMRWIQRRVDHVVVVLPFEAELYRKAGVRCTFVGHPLLDAVAAGYDRSRLRAQFGLSADGRVIGLLPGSRSGELTALLPVILEAAARLARREPATQFVLAQAPTIEDALLASCLAGSPVPVTIVKEQASEVMACSDLILVASGTATLQAAVVGTPMVLLYRMPWITYWLARWLVRVKWIGLVNLVAGRAVVPELIQGNATGQRAYEEAVRILEDRAIYDEMKRSLAQVKDQLGAPGASARAAEAVWAACRP